MDQANSDGEHFQLSTWASILATFGKSTFVWCMMDQQNEETIELAQTDEIEIKGPFSAT